MTKKLSKKLSMARERERESFSKVFGYKLQTLKLNIKSINTYSF
jgi:hypothetical protein